MDVSCEIDEYFENWRDWFLLEEDKEKGILELLVNDEKVIEKKVINNFSSLRCKLRIINFVGKFRSVGAKFTSSSVNFRRTTVFNEIIVTEGSTISIDYHIIE